MSSQDTMNYAQSEEVSAEAVQAAIEKAQAAIAGMESQSDIDTKNQEIAGLQQEKEQHDKNARELRQKVINEQKQEQEEQMREQDKDKDGLAKNVIKAAASRGIFG